MVRSVTRRPAAEPAQHFPAVRFMPPRAISKGCHMPLELFDVSMANSQLVGSHMPPLSTMPAIRRRSASTAWRPADGASVDGHWDYDGIDTELPHLSLHVPADVVITAARARLRQSMRSKPKVLFAFRIFTWWRKRAGARANRGAERHRLCAIPRRG
jgi:hypothetical protein